MLQSTQQQQTIPQSIPSGQQTGEYTLYIGAMSCMRHRGEEFYELNQEGKLAYLILEEIDYITGDYLNKIREAAIEVNEESHPSSLKIAVGCQSALLSTDYAMLKQELTGELGIPVVVDENCHLNGFNNHGEGHGDHDDHDNHGGHGDHDDHGGHGGHNDRDRGSGHERSRDHGKHSRH